MKFALFAYDFNHTKTKDFILVLEYLGYKLDCILAAPRVELNLSKSQIRTSIRISEYFHPKNIAKMFHIPYFVVTHNSDECRRIIKERDINIGIIGGARIISKETIDVFSNGIINFHPGILPQNRGLDNLKWAIHLNLPQVVTTHFIDERVDAGRKIIQKQIPVYFDDTLYDINQRLYETQLELIENTLKAVEGKKLTDFSLVIGGKNRSIMPLNIEKNIPFKFEKYKQKFGVSRDKD